MDKGFWRDNGVLIVFALIGLTISATVLSYQTGQPLLPRIDLWAWLAPYIPGALSILKTGLLAIAITVAAIVIGLLTIPFRHWLEHRMNKSIAKTASQHHDKPVRVNIPGWHVVAQSDSRLQAAIQDRDDWKHKYHALHSSYQQLAQASTGSSEGTGGAQILTYASVVALLQERPTSINRAQEIVRRGGGTVPRDYSPLREIVKLLHPSPIEEDTPIHDEKQAVNTVNGVRVNGATGRSQPRKGRRG